jgi:hypothetical protein
MSETAVAIPPADTAPVPPAETPNPYRGPVLPESSGIKPNQRHDASEFFDKKPAAPAAIAEPAKPVEPAKVEVKPKQEVVSPDEIDSPMLRALEKKSKPAAAPVVATPVQPASVDNPEDKIELASNAHASTKDQFKSLKTITRELRGQLTQAQERERSLNEQLKSHATAQPQVDNSDVERLRAEHKAMSDRLALVDLQSHPTFQQQYVQPKNQSLTEAQQLLEANGVTDVKVEGLLNKPRSEFGKLVSEAASKLSDFDKVDFASHMRKAWELEQGSRSALNKSRELMNGIAQQNGAKQRGAFEKTWGAVAGSVNEHIVELEPLPTATAEERASIESYNQSIKNLRINAEKLALNPMDEEGVSKAAIKAAAYDFHIAHAMPRLEQEMTGLLRLVRDQAAELKAIRARNPNSDRSHAPAVGTGRADPSKMDAKEAAEYFFNRKE